MSNMVRFLIGFALAMASTLVLFITVLTAIDAHQRQNYKPPQIIRMGPNK